MRVDTGRPSPVVNQLMLAVDEPNPTPLSPAVTAPAVATPAVAVAVPAVTAQLLDVLHTGGAAAAAAPGKSLVTGIG